ncbi:hypothetical protein GQ43DRAFT_462745 [Delitschia confertaspora ATCC 74209]|uniref:Zn(2)-C6 fungal-type domain-containing protein n=1 Tax=Delitschia confertaspora ATCC 74209 TaxID=1513339 RepID=A0A9P4JSV6_9PLEO|nr:hypothetical protein GQ43DRAFT_462745 [Delitschia confertaspora ATCC 74209]
MSIRRTSVASKSMQTCDVCKLRHQKCSGDRPSCTHCQLRNLHCIYSSIPAHKVDRSVVKRKDSVVDANTTSKRTHETLSVPGQGKLPPNFNLSGEQSSNAEGTTLGRRPSPHKARPPRSAATASLQYLVAAIRLLILGEEEGENRMELRNPPSPDHTTTTQFWKSADGRPHKLLEREDIIHHKQYYQTLLDAFLDGPNKFIFICDPAESRLQFAKLYDEDNEVHDDLLALIFLQLSLGAQCMDGINDVECALLHESGHGRIESALEQTDQECWLWVIQAFLLSCLYGVVTRPSRCYINIGSAIRVAQTYRIDAPYEESSVATPEEYAKWRRIWLSTIFMDAWFSAALGRLPQITSSTSKDPLLRDMRYGLPSPHSVQTNLARLGVVTSSFLVDIHGTEKADLSTYDQYVLTLRQWSEDLPPVLRSPVNLQNHINNTPLSTGDRSSMFYLQIAYLGTLMLLTRPLLIYSAAVERQNAEAILQQKIRNHAENCVATAIRIGQACDSMMTGNLLVKRAWLVIYISFNASLIIMLNQSRQVISALYHMGPAHQFSFSDEEETGLNRCLDVLEFCSRQDTLGQHYLNIARAFRNRLLDLAPRGPEPSFTGHECSGDDIKPPIMNPFNMAGGTTAGSGYINTPMGHPAANVVPPSPFSFPTAVGSASASAHASARATHVPTPDMSGLGGISHFPDFYHAHPTFPAGPSLSSISEGQPFSHAQGDLGGHIPLQSGIGDLQEQLGQDQWTADWLLNQNVFGGVQ